jgi:uncharacterized membrane protein YbhN (UPF0104 family)
VIVAEPRRIAPWLRWAGSLLVLAAVLAWLDPGAVFGQMVVLSPSWLALAVLVGVLQTLLSAWRWRYTTQRIGLALSPSRAVSDYFLASFFNQVLPGGVMGDAWRAQRHARVSGRAGAAWRAVIIERTSGQVVVAATTVAVLMITPAWRRVVAGLEAPLAAWAAGLMLFLVPIGLFLGLRPGFAALLAAFGDDLRRALLARSAWPRQLAASALIVASYALCFALAGWSIGVDAGLGQMMALAPPILLAMLIPLSVAGWGFREAAAASAWMALGLPAEQGAAVSMTYGLVMLVAAAPGALVLVCRPAR